MALLWGSARPSRPSASNGSTARWIQFQRNQEGQSVGDFSTLCTSLHGPKSPNNHSAKLLKIILKGLVLCLIFIPLFVVPQNTDIKLISAVYDVRGEFLRWENVSGGSLQVRTWAASSPTGCKGLVTGLRLNGIVQLAVLPLFLAWFAFWAFVQSGDIWLLLYTIFL